jgi:hypothetical protein
MKQLTIILALFILASVVFPLQVVEPAVKEISDGDTIFIGTIGPGQTISIGIHPKVYTGGKFGEGGRYDYATVDKLPTGWKGKNSKLYGDPLQVEITAEKNAPEGEYTAEITVQDEDNGEKLGQVKFKVKIKIVHDVLDVDVTPTSMTVGPGQPARFAITITNKGTASDVFNVKADGVERWIFEKPVHVPKMSSKTIVYEITESEEETYFPVISVVSTSSPLIHQEQSVVFKVQPDLLSDFKATNHGILIFPIFEAPVYSLAGLISNLWN